MSTDDDIHIVPPPPVVAVGVFGDRLELAQQYARILADAGTIQGLVGPREIPRIWDRHLLNCAVVSELMPHGARVVDVGSGAGLPGLVLAICRPDLQVELVEPMQRRIRFLFETVTELGMSDTVRITLGRAPEIASSMDPSPWVVARAVAPLRRLVPQCLPLLDYEGSLLAMKGVRAEHELSEVCDITHRLGMPAGKVIELGMGILSDPTRVVQFRRGSQRGAKGVG